MAGSAAGRHSATPFRIGTRGSALALAQAQSVSHLLEEAGEGLGVEIVPIATSGDRSDKSRFVKEIDDALLRGQIDLAVHSAKDVPGGLPTGLVIAGAPAAEDPRDALVGSPGLAELAHGARVGTSSLRRRSQILAHRPDLEIAELHGNVDTRLAKLAEGGYEAIVLALAGLRRLGRGEEAGAALDIDRIIPAPGQGVLALEARGDDERAISLAKAVTDRAALERLDAERAVVTALDATCRTPVGVHLGHTEEGRLRLQAYVGLPDGSEWIRDALEDEGSEANVEAGAPVAAAPALGLGERLAERLLAAGAGDLLQRADQLAAEAP